MPDATDPPRAASKVPAVHRAVAVLRHLGAAREPLGVNHLARELDLVPSTCLHILRALVSEGLVEFDRATKRYRIGVGILPIARSAIERNDFASVTRPRLAALSRRFEVTAMATQLIEAREMVVIALAHAALPFRLSTDLGSHFPALTSATGRCVAAFGHHDDARLEKDFARVHWDNPPGFAAWRAQLEETRRAGYGVDRGEFLGGVTIVAAPLFDADGAVERSLVALGTSERMEAVGTTVIARQLLRLRDEVDASLIAG